MRKIFSFIFVCCLSLSAYSQHLYIKTFGKRTAPALVFLHGGPGYNSANFEATTAQKLADRGFFVIVYDRRGEGRSQDPKALFTFQQSFDDLLAIYKQYGLAKAHLLGHSFGGVVAVLFAEKYPQNIASLVLVGAPVDLQESFKTIITAVKEIYQQKGDQSNLAYIAALEKMDKSSLEYSSYSLLHAMQNGFYTPKKPGEEAKQIYASFRTDSLLRQYASQMSYQAPQGFWKNEQYTSLNLQENLKQLQVKNIKIRALYGKDDGLYSVAQVAALQKLLGEDNLKYLDDCSHNVFIDQQSQFLDFVEKWAK
jgi:proline iminopeptidase